MDIFTWVLVVIGVWQIVLSLMLEAKNVKSKIVFNVIPFFSGMYCLVYALIQGGILILSK